MNLIDAYRYLAALEQHRHFGRAAAACYITQPALSNALRALETHFGVAIVRRGRQYEGLTPEGERVLSTAHRVLHEQELLQQELAGTEAQPRGRLLVGAVPTAIPVAARFAARLVQRYPGLSPQLLSMSSQAIDTGLVALSLDIALGYIERPGEPPAGVTLHPQYVEHYYLVQRDDDPAATGLRFGEPLPWEAAARQPLALLSPEMHNRAIVDGVFRQLGLPVKPTLETNSITALVVAVKAGGVASVLPGALVATLQGTALRAHALESPSVRTPIGFMVLGSVRPSRALQAALALATDTDWLADMAGQAGPLHPPAL